MKRKGNLYKEICSTENLDIAEQNARRGKANKKSVRDFNAEREKNIDALRERLETRTFRTSEYRSFTVYEPKKREIDALPHSDNVVDHAIIQVLGPIWRSTFTSDTYACIKGRGLHQANRKIRRAFMTDGGNMRYCLSTDIQKFYASIDHGKLKSIVRRKIKCKETLWLLDEIIDSHPGVPIGRYISPYLANLYLTGWDHKVKEHLKVRHYYRYNDNMLFFSDSKIELHSVLHAMREEMSALKLEINPSWQIFPTESRGVDFCGYVFYPTHTLLRKSIKKRIFRRKEMSEQSIAAYNGWLKWCDSVNLKRKIEQKYKNKKQWTTPT